MNSGEYGTGSITLTREELYRKVWREPMTKLAPQFGLSDTALAKICRKHEIPLPPVGYWARHSLDPDADAVPLPKVDNDSLRRIAIHRKQFPASLGRKKESTDRKVDIKVPARLSKPHSSVARTQRMLAKAQVSDDGLLTCDHGTCLNVRVAPKSLPRSLRILDAAIKKWEELGGCIVTGTKHEKALLGFSDGDETVNVGLQELTTRVQVPPSKNRPRHTTRLQPTGRLVLYVDNCGDGLRRRWSDGKTQKLEDMLGDCIEGLQLWLDCLHQRRKDSECYDRQRERIRETRRRKKRFRDEHKSNTASLEKDAQNWQKSDLIRRYLFALESAVESGKVSPSEPERFPEWLEWAKWYAESIDPCVPTPEREEVKDSPENMPVSQLDLTHRTRSILSLLRVEDADGLYAVDETVIKEMECKYNAWGTSYELADVLEALGYDVSSRERR